MAQHNFRSNETIHWPGGSRDFVLWLRVEAPFADRPRWKLLDLWTLRDSDTVTITNRWDDLPAWFELHPLEVCGRYMSRMHMNMVAGTVPEEPLDGPGLWRVCAGDRLVRIVADRGSTGDSISVISFGSCALAFGDEGGTGPGIGFGRIPDLTRAEADLINAGIAAAAREGGPRTWGPEWRLG